MKRAAILLTVALVALVVAIVAFKLLFLSSFEVRRKNFLISVHYEVDGANRVASSVLEYRYRYESLGGFGITFGGLSPIMDIGRHGNMALALYVYGKVDESTGKINGHNCIGTAVNSWPLYAYNIVAPHDYPNKNGANPMPLVDLWLNERSGRAELPIERWPAFLWQPPGTTSETDFRFIYACSFDELFHGGVKIHRVTIEPTDEPLVTELLTPPQWVESWRREIDALPKFTSGRHVYLNVIDYPTQDELSEQNQKSRFRGE